MRIEAVTDAPKTLVIAIDKALTEGNLRTWKIVKSNQGELLYTHTPEQWNEKALIARQVKQDRVNFEINWWSGKPEPSIEIQGYYFGRFTEVLLVHFRNYYDRLEVF